MLTRRAVLPLLAVSAIRPARASVRARVEAIETISQEPQYYHGWPTLARRGNGELLVACSGGRETHVCPFGRVELIRSSDDGKSWSWPEVLMDTVIDDRDAGVVETKAGSLLVTTFTSLAYQAVLAKSAGWDLERLSRWRAAERRATQPQRESLLGTWMLRSTDGGMNWSAPYRVPLNSPHGPAALSDGRLLYAGKQLWEPGRKVGVCESRDDGRTWQWLADIKARPGETTEEYHELHVVQASANRIVVHIRNENSKTQRETLQCESSDGGRTWTEPHAIGVPGYPSHLLRLKDGRLLMSYGYRLQPFGNRAQISEDQGKTWSAPMIISDDGGLSDLGYPSTVELAGGSFVTVWYEQLKTSPRAVLRMARWSAGA